MPLKPELQEIVDEMEFDSEEDRAAFEKVLSGKAGEKIQKGYMKNKDYTTKTQALSTAKQQLDTERDRFNQQQDYVAQQMNQYKTEAEKRINDAVRQAANANLYGAALKNKLQVLATQYGEDVDELLADVQEIRDDKINKPAAADADEDFKKNFVPRAEYEAATSAYFGFSPMLRDIERDYERLSGKQFDGSMHELVTEAVKNVNIARSRGEQIDIPTYLRQKLDFDGLRQQKAAADEEARRKEREEWERKTREDIERDVRSKIVTENPRAFAAPKDEWREKLGPQHRNQDNRPSAMDQVTRRRSIHAAYEERAQKSGT